MTFGEWARSLERQVLAPDEHPAPEDASAAYVTLAREGRLTESDRSTALSYIDQHMFDRKSANALRREFAVVAS